MEVVADLHLLGKRIESIRLEEAVADSFNRFKIEFLPEMYSTVFSWDASSLFAHSMETEVLVDVFCFDLSVGAESEEVKERVLVDCTVCLLGDRHTFSKQTSQLTGFVKY